MTGQEPTDRELEPAVQRPTEEAPSLLTQSILEIRKSIRSAKIRLASQQLKKTTTRNLEFPVGRYWVDEYSKLINLNDNEIGIWGVDYSRMNCSPMFDRR
jgi:hypothetical protein